MKDSEQTREKRLSESFTQEMRQAFVDWMNKLPFIKKDIAKDPGAEDVKKESAARGPALHPTDGVVAGQPLESERKHR